MAELIDITQDGFLDSRLSEVVRALGRLMQAVEAQTEAQVRAIQSLESTLNERLSSHD